MQLHDEIHEMEAYRPWLRVESNDVELASEGKNWLGRWGLNVGRKLPLGDEAQGQPLERVIELAQATILQHMAETQGRIKSGHRIDGYLLYHRDDQPALRMNLEGQVIGTGPKPRDPMV